MPVHTCACVKGEKELRLKVFSPASMAVRNTEAGAVKAQSVM